ncbi:MAG: DUF3179 domain-containing protein [Actinomycetota bacterium]|nr:DUF3179 domain-containing protein [Actinomycetota bacterium]MDH5313415.1 DUF3179 domain-containing protein [Actinomycetota bacterium]
MIEHERLALVGGERGRHIADATAAQRQPPRQAVRGICEGRLPSIRVCGRDGSPLASPARWWFDGRHVTIEAGPTGLVDRETSSHWDIFGRATSGPLRGARLDPIVAVDHLWFDWRAFHPGGRVVGIDRA